jgi:hypothetical protein
LWGTRREQAAVQAWWVLCSCKRRMVLSSRSGLASTTSNAKTRRRSDPLWLLSSKVGLLTGSRGSLYLWDSTKGSD